MGIWVIHNGHRSDTWWAYGREIIRDMHMGER